MDGRHRPRDLAGDEGLAADRAFVVEQDAVGGMEAIGLAVVHGDPVGVELGSCVGRARIERGRLRLRHLLYLAIKLRGGRLVEPGLVAKLQEPHRLQQTQRADPVGIGGILRRLEAHLHVGLGGKVIHLVWLDFLHQPDQVGGIRHVPVMQEHLYALLVRVMVQVIDAAGVERRRTPLHPVHLVALVEQQFGQIGAVLPGNAGDKCTLGHKSPKFSLSGCSNCGASHRVIGDAGALDVLQ